MKHIVFLLEEPSAKEMLEGLLPRLAPEVSYRCIVFEGKQDLEKNLVKKIRAYRVPNSQFIVLRDQDAGDCYTIKQKLVELCQKANKADSLVRIVCRELESWYLADLKAVELGLKISGLAKHQGSQKYRSPDYLDYPSKELKHLTNDKYQKVAGSRKIGPHLDLTNKRSNSFRVFIEGIRKML
ncbi:hypothetical protein PN36_10255 [Candidatus Thiomargarita nelsonii]|uniref:DUF4276 family protein n=1 Tax=Candidatus Thiomargarita nelsonii TaxID=1003181 RepID=A0A0A6PDU3_9GAMM|nr:hypothetical protein PN36_10255 [Candidatus Thiomargarita nelsonii]